MRDRDLIDRDPPPYVSYVAPPADPVAAKALKAQLRPRAEQADPRIRTLRELLDDPGLDNTDCLRALVEVLQPRACEERIDDWIRAGLPGSSLGSGSKSAESPIPRLDQHDVDMQTMLERYGSHLEAATRHLREREVKKAEKRLEAARVIETGVLMEQHMGAEKWSEYVRSMRVKAEVENGTEGRDCANPHCHHRIMGGKKDPMRHGRCKDCDRYMTKYNRERPEDLCERSLAREVERAVLGDDRRSA